MQPYHKLHAHPANVRYLTRDQAVELAGLKAIEELAAEVIAGQHQWCDRRELLRLVYARVRRAMREAQGGAVTPPPPPSLLETFRACRPNASRPGEAEPPQ